MTTPAAHTDLSKPPYRAPDTPAPSVGLVFPALPPALDGIGDHTARLAAALAAHGPVRVFTAQPEAEPVERVPVELAFSVDRPSGVLDLVDAVAVAPPDWLLVQFNQFSYGRWGWNPYLPFALHRLQRLRPALRVAVLFHEDFVPVTSWKFAVMTTYQRAQFWALGRLADHVFFSIDPWARRYRSWFPRTPVTHLPVGSNMPYLGADRAEARRRVGLTRDALVVGVFGTLSASRPLTHLRAALEAIYARRPDLTVLYVGPDGETLRAALPDLPVHDAGALPADAVSVHLSAMDLHLAPFVDGASTRRGSFLAGLQHGAASVSTHGPLTDAELRAADRAAFMLTPAADPDAFARAAVHLAQNAAERDRVGRAGQAFFDARYAWPELADRLQRALHRPPTLNVTR